VRGQFERDLDGGAGLLRIAGAVVRPRVEVPGARVAPGRQLAVDDAPRPVEVTVTPSAPILKRVSMSVTRLINTAIFTGNPQM
jgi:hypothetical protein